MKHLLFARCGLRAHKEVLTGWLVEFALGSS